MSGKMRGLKVLADYGADANAVIVQEFTDRWRTQGWRKRASVAWLRKRRAAGVSRVAVDVGGRVADFSVDELLKGGTL